MALLPNLAQPPVRLGCTPFNVERLGFGTWAWGNKLLWGYEPDADLMLQAAFDSVIQPSSPLDRRRFFFDTGDSYGTGALEGQAERLLGRFRRESGWATRAVIGTKLAVYPTRLTGASFEEACRSSLARMGRKRMEVVQAHWSATNFQPWQEPALWDGLARCYEAELAESVGTSNFGPEQLMKVNTYWRDRGVPHAINQVQFSLLSTLPLEAAFLRAELAESVGTSNFGPEQLMKVNTYWRPAHRDSCGLFEACAELGVTPIGYSPLALGLLSGKYDEQNLPAGPRGLLFKQILPGLAPLLGVLNEVARARGKSVAAVALNWCMCKGALVIVGIKTPQQAAENLSALGWRLRDAEVEELERAARTVPRKATQNVFQTK
eukprot:CAMPEP_0119345298 /NCGR_PEP_ID=MMETSP1333-20130426/107413_1 /TAXON_ID=418940 /ORGANISM="Scyphosphaera apsteinii, Strain RCC1455" /LENGTH=377 /DNA_ID=CAMNT_0007357761 /DNA_START=115 /DNA_END=1249 /DNA_ORIENTATION=+